MAQECFAVRKAELVGKLWLEIHAAQEVSEPRVRAQRIVGWVHFKLGERASYRAVLISLFQPLECLVLVSATHIGSNPGYRWNIPFLRNLIQFIEHLLCLCYSTCHRIRVSK